MTCQLEVSQEVLGRIYLSSLFWLFKILSINSHLQIFALFLKKVIIVVKNRLFKVKKRLRLVHNLSNYMIFNDLLMQLSTSR
jgi:hypothetical protein